MWLLNRLSCRDVLLLTVLGMSLLVCDHKVKRRRRVPVHCVLNWSILIEQLSHTIFSGPPITCTSIYPNKRLIDGLGEFGKSFRCQDLCKYHWADPYYTLSFYYKACSINLSRNKSLKQQCRAYTYAFVPIIYRVPEPWQDWRKLRHHLDLLHPRSLQLRH